jgi:acetyl/propionyl-CoA carboxylase alpha subunit
MTPELRSRMGDAAVTVVRAAGYTNAGTVEFMVDRERNFYFLEMNTRLQVEHPVTELVTGIDIVKEQFRIAAGERLTLKQDGIRMTGAAIECRISAEDPESGFAPSVGEIIELIEPGGIGIRVESGVHEGFQVPVYYDPLVAKLLAWAPTRSEAIVRMKRALAEYAIRGIKTTIPFHRLVMEHPKFIEGDYDTTFIDRVLGKITYPKEHYRVAAIAASRGRMLERERVRTERGRARQTVDPWKTAGRQAMMRR